MFHTVVHVKSVGEVLLGPLNDSRHVVFPHTSWAYHMINCDPRRGDRVNFVRVESCDCDPTTTITASDFMKMSHMERYGEKWDGSYSTTEFTTHRVLDRSERPIEVRVDWSGERRPVLTRAQRAQEAVE